MTGKDLILAIIAKFGIKIGTGHIIEYRDEATRNFSMDGRMRVCNMSIEGGARGGLISPDEKSIEYLRNREHVPQGEAFDQLAEQWLELATDEGAVYDQQLTINAREVEPQVTWGTNPGMCVP